MWTLEEGKGKMNEALSSHSSHCQSESEMRLDFVASMIPANEQVCNYQVQPTLLTVRLIKVQSGHRAAAPHFWTRNGDVSTRPARSLTKNLLGLECQQVK